MSATTVPGVVGAWHALHSKHGKLDWSLLFQPAITLALQGFNVTEHSAKNWAHIERVSQAHAAGLLDDGAMRDFASVFAPGNTIPRPGEYFRNPCLAKTLSSIATLGAKEFYLGAIAQDMDQYMRDRDGLLVAEDLKRYWQQGAQWVTPEKEVVGNQYVCLQVYAHIMLVLCSKYNVL
jgi:gamma-glutamyltranspeptidase/glutathione hydrolase